MVFEVRGIRMTAKEYLNQAQNLEIKINQIQSEIDLLRKTATDIGSGLSSEIKVSKSSFDNASYTYKIDGAADLEKELKTQKELLLIKRNEIVNAIHKLDNPLYIDILFKRYIEYKSFKRIAKELNYDYGYVRKLHQKALKRLIF